MRRRLEILFEGGTLTRSEAAEALCELAGGSVPPAQIAAFLAAYRMRPPLLDELEGFRDALLELAVTVDLDEYRALDVCGTGGDGKQSINISTLSAFVVAGAGVPVAKHGNHGVSSACGSATVLEALGVRFSTEEKLLRRAIERAGICFLHAPLFHPALKQLAPVRKELGVRTFFNLLGPLVNPSNPRRQVIGVPDLSTARLFSYLLQRTDKDYFVVHSLDGFDEISLGAPAKVIGRSSERLLDAAHFGLAPVAADSLGGGNTVDSAKRAFMSLLDGDAPSSHTRVVVANAALALQCAGQAQDLLDCVRAAEESLASGRAKGAFVEFHAVMNGNT